MDLYLTEHNVVIITEVAEEGGAMWQEPCIFVFVFMCLSIRIASYLFCLLFVIQAHVLELGGHTIAGKNVHLYHTHLTSLLFLGTAVFFVSVKRNLGTAVQILRDSNPRDIVLTII